MARPAKTAGGGWGLMLFGVVLPGAVILIELLTGMCAESFFDPIPTPWHLALALAVPGANVALWAALQAAAGGNGPRRLLPLGLLNGLAIAGGAYFAILFLPLLPLAVIALVVFGMGLLPMGPMIGFVAAVRARQRLAAWAQSAGRNLPGTRRGLALGAVLVGWLVTPGFVTNRGLRMAASDDAAVREHGVALLRRFGSEQRLLAACYERRRGEMGDPWGGRGVGAAAAQKAYYRVTGRPFESMPNPLAGRRGAAARFGPGAPRDDDAQLRGGEAVGTLLPGLSVASSSIEGSVNADAATAYFEWTMEFHNARDFAQEARARVALPRGGCVSRLTLWIDGEPREAAWGERGRVRRAYEQVVKVQRRDPVLVTSAGADRVMMQCFPVPPGGRMKVRLGVTAPLQLAAADRGEVTLPRLLDRNFRVDGAAGHAVRVESRGALAAGDRGLAAVAAGRAGVNAIGGAVSEARLAGRVNLSVARDPAASVAWFDDPFDGDGMTVVQRVEAAAAEPPSRVVLAVDASAPMRPALDALADALSALPAATKVTALASSDAGVVTVAEGETAAGVARALRKLPCVGGQDGAPLLAEALEVAASEPGAVVLWVHGPQPVELEPAGRLAEGGRAAGAGPAVTAVQVGGGRNVVGDALAGLTGVESTDASANLRGDLAGVFAGWSAPREKLRLVRERRRGRPAEEVGEVAGEAARRGDLQLVRLWARDEVSRLCASGAAESHPPSVRLAVSHQIVTPVSAAVVLETQSQYDAAGLSPAAAVPLPAGVWAAMVAAPLVYLARRRLRRAAPA